MPTRSAAAPPAAPATERNHVLRALPPDAYASLAPLLEPVQVGIGDLFWRPGERIEAVYFPRDCVFSLLTPLAADAPVEAATVGCEGLLGVPVLLDAWASTTIAQTQIPGAAARADAARFAAWLDGAGRASRPRFLQYAQALYDQTAQTVACNRRHSMEERCARWLLMTQDRVASDAFPLKHEFLAAMLGVRRASVTVAAGMLQEAGLIHYRRGRIAVRDRERLEEAACECYRTVRDHYDGLPSAGAHGLAGRS